MHPNSDPNPPEHEKKDRARGVDFIGVNCVFFCHDGNGRVLLHKRSRNCRDERGMWDCGGGAMEFGETFEQTVRREVMEEYGVEPLNIEYVATMNVLRDHEGHLTHWIKNLHVVRVDPEKVRIGDPEKIDEIGWFHPDNPPSPLHSQWMAEMELVKKYITG